MGKKDGKGQQGFGDRFGMGEGLSGISGMVGIDFGEMLRRARTSDLMPDYIAELLEPVSVDMGSILSKEAGKRLVAEEVNKRLTKRVGKLHKAIHKMVQEHADQIEKMSDEHEDCHKVWINQLDKLEQQSLNSGAGLSSVDDLLYLLIGRLSDDETKEMSKADLIEKLEEMRDVADDARHRAETMEGYSDPNYQSRRDRRKAENQPVESGDASEAANQ